jgi:hypothetical protein
MAFYVNALTVVGQTRADLLIDFALSPENQQDIAGFLVNTSNGPYADATDPLPAATVLGEVTTGGILNTSVISLASIAGNLTANGITVIPAAGSATTGSVIVSSSAPTETLDLSANFANATVQNSGSTVVDSSANSVITLTGANNTTLSLGHGGVDVVNLLGGTNTTIQGFVPGTNSSLNVTNSNVATNVQILDGTATPVSGLTFGNGANYIINIGNVGNGSAASVAAAANAAYVVSDASGTGTATGTGEHVTFMGYNSSGNTMFWFFGSTQGAANGIIPASSLVASADVNLNHQVDAAEITLVATVNGVLPTAFSVSDLA